MVHLTVQNNICYLKSDSDDFDTKSLLHNYLTVYERVRRIVGFNRRTRRHRFEFLDQELRLYTEVGENLYSFPRGLYTLMERGGGDYPFDVTDASTSDYSVPADVLGTFDIPDILRPYASFSLRDDQVLAVTKALVHKRGVIQMPTGSGKSEVMAGILTVLESVYPDIRVTVIEPTDVLVNKTTERFNRYHLNAVRYKDVRHSDGRGFNVLVAHPTALLSDAEKDQGFLRGMAGVFWDECQHCRCETWKGLNRRLPDCEYALGFSALAVEEEHIYETSLRVLTPDEVMVEGATGPVIVNVPPKYYIDRDILATPVIVQLLDDLPKGLSASNDWAKLRIKGIESKGRTALTAKAIDMFDRYGRRVLVLVGTKKQGESIASVLATDYGSSDRIGISYGAGESYTISPSGDRRRYDGEDIVRDFDDGRFSILISTSHMDEGVDLSNLDVAVLASGGKKDRRIVQRIGRALRNNKTGKYAYIVDFYDSGSGILQKHSDLRMRLYKSVIQVPRDLIYEKTSVEVFEPYFKALEGMRDESPSDRLMGQFEMLSDGEDRVAVG